MLDLQLVVPCFKPPKGWGARLCHRFRQFAAGAGGSVGLVLVDDGSPGGLAGVELEPLRALPRFKFISYPDNRGKGAALRMGVAATDAKLVLYTDVDLPYTLDSMLRVYRALQTDGGVVAGERHEDYYANVPAFRRRLSHFHRRMMRSFFRLPVSDSQAGLKGFAAVGKGIFLRTTIDRFLVDLDFLARCRGRVAVRPVRVELRPDVEFTDFGVGILVGETANFAQVFRGSWFGWRE